MIDTMSGEIRGTVAPEGYTEIGTDDQITGLYGALAKAQMEFGPISRSKDVEIRTKDGSAYRFRYAPLEDMLAATRPSLGAHGLAVLTPMVRARQGAKVLVILAHEGGGRTVTEFAFEPLPDMKNMAGQITYLRRYGYSSVLNLAADDDAEGSVSSGPPRQNAQGRQGTQIGDPAKVAPGRPAAPAGAAPVSEVRAKLMGEWGVSWNAAKKAGVMHAIMQTQAASLDDDALRAAIKTVDEELAEKLEEAMAAASGAVGYGG